MADFNNGLSVVGDFTTIVADGTPTARLRGVTGKVVIYGYADATRGAILDSTNTAETAALPITISGSNVLLTTAGVERARIDSNGNLLVGVGSGASHIIKSPTTVQGNVFLELQYGGGGGLAFQYSTGGGSNAAAAQMVMGKNSVTSRSLNAGGTINASGADYAEYMRKAHPEGYIAKGQVVGIDAQGRVTDVWLESISFMVKTTNPSYVGGDTWGNEDAVGKRPAEPLRILDITEQRLVSEAVGDVEAVYSTVVLTPGDTDVEWAAKQDTYTFELDAFEVALELARQSVDRIAFAGQVPCNVIGATPGQYIVPVQDGTGPGIKGIAISEADMTLIQYMKAVGKVIAIESDGRARILVKVA